MIRFTILFAYLTLLAPSIITLATGDLYLLWVAIPAIVFGAWLLPTVINDWKMHR